MRSSIKFSILGALPLLLTACQTYDATYVDAPAVRRTYIVDRGYDPYYAPRPVYRDRFYNGYEDDYRPRRSNRGSYGYDRPYRGPVAQPGDVGRAPRPPQRGP